MKKYEYIEYPDMDKKIAEISFPFNDISDDNINDAIVKFLERENYTITKFPKRESWGIVIGKIFETDEGKFLFKKEIRKISVYTTKIVYKLVEV